MLMDLTGQRFGQQTVIERDMTWIGKPRWRVRCDCGKERSILASNLRQGTSTRCGSCAARLKRASEPEPNPRVADDLVTYDGVHHRLAVDRGPAKMHQCAADCGRPATGWAYQHDDPAERTEPRLLRTGKIVMVAFSPNQQAYAPMCTRCHRALDRAHAATAVGR